MIVKLIVFIIGSWFIFSFLNWLSYCCLKNKHAAKTQWDLNICCGKTSYGRINADIIKHAEIDNFILIDNIYQLPFSDQQFNTVLCSHAIEHVDDPLMFDRELRRIGKSVHYLVPPLWDLSAAFNIIEHKWLFLTFKTYHRVVPKHVRLPLANTFQSRFGQVKKA
jgi:hypothetical protein